MVQHWLSSAYRLLFGAANRDTDTHPLVNPAQNRHAQYRGLLTLKMH
jgi:hypothetical protein